MVDRCQVTSSNPNETPVKVALRYCCCCTLLKHKTKILISSCFIQTERHLPVVEENEVLALVGNERFEVRPDDAVPRGPVLHFELGLTR